MTMNSLSHVVSGLNASHGFNWTSIVALVSMAVLVLGLVLSVLAVRLRRRLGRLIDSIAAAHSAQAGQLRHDAVIDATREAVITVDENHRIVLFNPAAERIFDCPESAALGAPLSRFIPALTAKRHDAPEQGEAGAPMESPSDVFGQRMNGEAFPIEVSISPLASSAAHDHASRFTTVLVRDTSQRRQTEQALRASEERLRLFVDHAPAAIAMLDREMRYIAVSRRWLSDYSLGDRDVLGLTHSEVFPHLSLHWEDIHKRCLDGAVESSEAAAFKRADGQMQWIKWEMRPWRDGHGDVGGTFLLTEVITDRRETEQALRESQQRLELAVAASGLGVWEWNLNTNKLIWSEEIWQIVTAASPGERASELSLESFTRFVHPDDLARLMAAAWEAVDLKKTSSLEFRIVRDDGEVRWLVTMGRAEYNEHGLPLRMLGTLRDITESKRAEQALRDAAELVQAVEDSVLDHLAVLDCEGKVIAVNAAWRQFAREHGGTDDLSDDRLGVGANYLDVCRTATAPHASDAMLAYDGINKVLRGQAHSFSLEYPCELPTGEPRWFHMTVTPLRRAAGGAVVAHSNVTARKLAQASLMRLEHRYRTIVEQSPDAILVIEGDSVSLANRACLELFGMSDISKLDDLKVMDLFDPTARAEILSHTAEVQGGEPVVFQARLRGRDGTEREVEVSAAAVPDHGQAATQMVMRDVTQRSRIAALLRESHEDLQRLSGNLVQVREEERKRIARELHDEFGQRLSAIKMQVLAIDGNLRVQPALRDQCAEAVQMINELMQSVRRIAADLRPAMLDDLGLDAAVEWLADECATHSGLTVVVHCGQLREDFSDDMKTTAYRMVQEALTNVRRHANASRVDIYLNCTDVELMVRVTDDGVGMMPADAKKLGSYGMVGMRERARQLGGSLAVANPPQGGCQLELRVPLRAPALRGQTMLEKL